VSAVMAEAFTAAAVLGFVAQMIRISVPYALGAMGTTFSERGGVINIAAEGIFLTSALAYTLAAYYTESGWLGVLAAIAAGLATAGLHALITVTFRADQITSGIGINLLAIGLTRFVLKVVFHSSSNSERVAGIPGWEIPFISSIPGIGSLLSTPLVLITMLLVGVSWWVLFRTPFGLRLRAVGEHPEAAATLGLRVVRWRYAGVLVSGVLAGLGGAWLASDQRMFTDGMSAGRGYIALAAMIVGKWNPIGAAAACLLFGAAEALQIRLQGEGMPNEFLQMLPYIVTMAVLAGAIGRSRPPASVGIPYDPEEH
jgi:ABC-type uncharacterized transport system permease subunit